MKRIWCDLCGKEITSFSYLKVKSAQCDCEFENEYDDTSYNYDGITYNSLPFPNPMEVHLDCFVEAFADFSKKKKLEDKK